MVDGEGREGWERGILILVSMARWDTYRGLTDSRFKTQFNLFAPSPSTHPSLARCAQDRRRQTTRQINPERHHSLSIPAQRHAASQQPAIHADLILIPIPIPAQGSRSMEMSHLHLACLPAPICTEGVPVRGCTHRDASLGWRRDWGCVLGLSLYPITWWWRWWWCHHHGIMGASIVGERWCIEAG